MSIFFWGGGRGSSEKSVTYDLNGSLPCLADFVAADNDPGQVEAEEEDDDAEGDVRHVQLAMVFALVRLRRRHAVPGKENESPLTLSISQ